MTNSNRIKLTWRSFLSYALTGALVIVTGMLMGNIADYFNLPVSSMSNTFTFLNAGILISIFLNAWLMEIVPLKTQLRFGFLLMVLAVAGLMFSHSLALFSAAMFILGVVSGITDPHTGDRRPLTEDTLRLLEKIAPSAHKIGASSAIEALHRQVVSGLNEAQLMRDFVADGGSLIGLVKKHCEIWAGD